MILVKLQTGQPFQLNDIQQFEHAKLFTPGLILLDESSKSPVKQVNQQVKVEIIEPKKVVEPKKTFDTLEYSVTGFQREKANFTKEQLEGFLNDKRATIVKLAKKELLNR